MADAFFKKFIFLANLGFLSLSGAILHHQALIFLCQARNLPHLASTHQVRGTLFLYVFQVFILHPKYLFLVVALLLLPLA
jgi:hypothetical protein